MLINRGEFIMEVNEVRQIALSLPEAEESAHWGKASFRVNNKIFTVIQSDMSTITVKTTSEVRELYTTTNAQAYQVPETFANMNYMHINLSTAPPDEIRNLIQTAWGLVAPKKMVKAFLLQQNK